MAKNKKMNILFDINHPVDINFFKNTISNLKEKGCDIIVLFRSRGKLEDILRFELKDVTIKRFGNHKKNLISKILYQLIRDFQVYFFLKKNKIDLIVSFGATSAIAARLAQIPYLAFDDDYEYKIPFYHANWFATKHIYPDFIPFSSSKSIKFHGFKELAYLHPDYLKISPEALSEYGLEPEKYVFIREIANVSLNYKEKSSMLSSIIKLIKEKGYKIVLSLEDKNNEKLYNSNCIILKEPIKDIYSLIFHAKYCISSGDTVARESALLGVPTIYTGGREMLVNNSLISLGLINKADDLNSVLNLLNDIDNGSKINHRSLLNELILEKWDNTTDVILDLIKEYM